MATPIAAKGTLIKKSTTQVVDVFEFSMDGIERAEAETTNLDDTWDTFIATMLDPGTVTFGIMYDPADTTHKAFITDLVDGSTDGYSITFSDSGASVWSFNAFVKKFAVTGSTKDKVTAQCTLRLTGAVTQPA